MTTRNRICNLCGDQFSYQVSRGTDRLYCSKACTAKSRAKSLAERKASLPRCSADGCEMAASRVGAGLCERHYYRMRRNGRIQKLDTVIPGSLPHSGGYKLVYAPEHPLRRQGSRVYEHRIVFYDAHGEGPFQCNWCSATVTWNNMHVDHLNSVRDDNRASNLVASCAACNTWRGKEKMKRTMQERGHMIEFQGERLHISEWAKRIGISRFSLNYRLKAWSLEAALTTPRGKTGPRQKKSN